MIRDQLDTIVKQLAEEMELPVPATLVVPSKKHNVALTWFGHPVVMLTDGLAQGVPVWQTQAVIAHELAHLKLNHPWQIGALKLLLGGIVGIGLFSQAWLALAVCVPVSFLAYGSYCWATEIAADELAARTIGNPMPLIAWLQTRKANAVSLTHPSCSQRIKKLSQVTLSKEDLCTHGSLPA